MRAAPQEHESKCNRGSRDREASPLGRREKFERLFRPPLRDEGGHIESRTVCLAADSTDKSSFLRCHRDAEPGRRADPANKGERPPQWIRRTHTSRLWYIPRRARILCLDSRALHGQRSWLYRK